MQLRLGNAVGCKKQKSQFINGLNKDAVLLCHRESGGHSWCFFICSQYQKPDTFFFLYSNVHYLLTLVLTVMCFGCHVYQADGEEHCRAVFSPDLFHLSERGKLFQQSHIRDLCRIIGYSGCKKIQGDECPALHLGGRWLLSLPVNSASRPQLLLNLETLPPPGHIQHLHIR